MRPKTILIGLDGATFSILDRLVDDGVLPFLKQFIASGVRAELESVIPPLTPPAWTSLMTGRSPGQHGIFDFFLKEAADSHTLRFASSQDVSCETIWSIASQQGMRVTVLNFPLTFPPPQINGNVVPGGWMPWRQLRLGCYPPDLYDRLKALPRFNARELAMDMAHEQKAVEGAREEEYESWLEQHIRREQQWFDILSYLVREDPCELTAVLFDGVDKIQHLCWRFLDPAYLKETSTAWERRIRELCLLYFRQLDRLLAEIDRLADGDATAILASDHGFGAQVDIFAVNTWLEQHGYLAWASETQPRETDGTRLGMSQLAHHVHLLDWERTLAYASTPSSNGIHIVAAGEKQTEPGVAPQGGQRGPGIGVPRSDYGRFRAKLIEELGQVISPTTGEPLVSRIWTREEAFPGPCMDKAPDLTLALWDGGQVSILATNDPVRPRPSPSGTHRPRGIFVARGPGVRKGVSLPALSILDIAPMALHSLGLTVPADLEGHLPVAAYESAWLEAHPVRLSAGDESSISISQRADVEFVYTEDEERELAARLRALGYIE